jgi:hypothetical protein
MKIAFNTPARKWIIAAPIAVLAVAYFGLATRELVASWLGSRPQLTSLRKAAWLDPGNADYRNHLGRYYDLVAHDPASAIGYYLSAVQLNPHSSRYWFDLANAYQILGDIPKQTEALEHAIQTDSMTPDVAWEAGNLYLVQGEDEKALREFRVVIANDTTLDVAALGLSWRIRPDVDALLKDVIPARAGAYLNLIALLESKGEIAGTMKVWDALMQTSEPFERRHAFDYIRYLIEHKEVDEAVMAWKQTTNRFGLSSYLPSTANLVVNGNFGLDPLNAGFDWQHQKLSNVTLTFDPGDFHAGRRSLLIAFDGPGIRESGLYQFIPVQPNTSYYFTAYYKNGEVEMQGAGGPHFTIQDMYTQSVYYESEELKEATFWKSAEGEFTTGPDCKLIVLHIRRLPAGSPMRGKLWVSDFHITKKTS